MKRSMIFVRMSCVGLALSLASPGVSSAEGTFANCFEAYATAAEGDVKIDANPLLPFDIKPWGESYGQGVGEAGPDRDLAIRRPKGPNKPEAAQKDEGSDNMEMARKYMPKRGSRNSDRIKVDGKSLKAKSAVQSIYAILSETPDTGDLANFEVREDSELVKFIREVNTEKHGAGEPAASDLAIVIALARFKESDTICTYGNLLGREKLVERVRKELPRVSMPIATAGNTKESSIRRAPAIDSQVGAQDNQAADIKVRLAR